MDKLQKRHSFCSFSLSVLLLFLSLRNYFYKVETIRLKQNFNPTVNITINAETREKGDGLEGIRACINQILFAINTFFSQIDKVDWTLAYVFSIVLVLYCTCVMTMAKIEEQPSDDGVSFSAMVPPSDIYDLEVAFYVPFKTKQKHMKQNIEKNTKQNLRNKTVDPPRASGYHQRIEV
jgi:hypothetical protein